MTDVTPNPGARYARLLARTQAAHELVSRLVDDLKEGEGRELVQGAQEDLSLLCVILETKKENARAGQ